MKGSDRAAGGRRAPGLTGTVILCAISLLTPWMTLAQSSNVNLVSQLTDYSYHSDIWGYSSPQGVELAIAGTLSGTTFINVTDPEAPVEAGFIPGPGSSWRDIKTFGSYAYIVNETGGGLQIVDLGNPAFPVLVGNQTSHFETAHNLFIDTEAGILYAVGTGTGTVLLSLENPRVPTLAGTFDDFYIHDIFARDGVAYAAAIFGGFVATLDVSNLPEIVELGRTTTPGSATHNTWLTEDGRFCVTTDEIPSGHLGFYDVSDPTDISPVSEWKNPEQPLSSVHNAFVRGDRIFASWYTAGLQILDISDIENPRRVGFFDTPAGGATFSGNWGAYPFAPDNLVYISDTDTGIYILRFEPDFAVVQGTVTDASNGEPVVGAVVSDAVDSIQTVTDTAGLYELVLGLGDHEIVFEAFGFENEVRTLSLTLPRDRSLDIELGPLPSGSLAGRVGSRDPEVPLSGAEVTLLDTPLRAQTDPDGSYRFERVPEGSYAVQVRIFGYASATTSADIQTGMEVILDVTLSEACFADNMEEDKGWTVGSEEDDALTGVWELVDPVGTGQGFVQPEEDHTPGAGSRAWVTGQAQVGGSLGDSDVDQGMTTLRSPLLDLAGAADPVLVYHRWYVNNAGANPGTDVFSVDASSDGGVTWVNLETLGETRPFWERVEWNLGLFLTPTNMVQIRFIASDFGGGSLVEAAIDDVEIYCESDDSSDPDPMPAVNRLLPSLPNPSRGPTLLRFQLAGDTHAALDVFDMTGRRVREIVGGSLGPGLHEYEWDGRNSEGNPVAGGIYFQRLEAAGRIETRKITLTR